MQTPVPCQWSGAAFAGAVQGSQPQSFGLITLFLLTEHLCLPPRNEHPVPGTWLGGAFKRQAAVKDKIGKDQMWPGGLSFGDYYLQGFRENSIGTLLGFTVSKPVFPRAQQSRAQAAQSQAVLFSCRGSRENGAKTDLCGLQNTNTERNHS